MKRDDDLIRRLLLDYENDEDWLLLVPGDTSSASAEERREHGNVLIMMDEGLLAPVGRGTMRLTAQGHDYLAAIRDEGVWKKTKDVATGVGGVTLGIMKEISIAYLKQLVAERFGVKL